MRRICGEANSVEQRGSAAKCSGLVRACDFFFTTFHTSTSERAYDFCTSSKEVSMLKVVIGLLAFLVVGSSLTYAQDTSPAVPSQTDFKVLTDARIGIVKAALQLTPEQEKLWPPVEEAIRARAEARYNRMVAVGEKLSQQEDLNPVELMRGRADAMADRAANLKKLADAWEPLYQTLNPDQKGRMRLLMMHVLGGMRGGMGNPGMDNPAETHGGYQCDKE